MVKITRPALAAAAVFLFARTASAQSAGSITGVVKDSSGAVLPGATVTLASPAIGVARTATSDARGVFLALPLPPGTYTVSVEMQGFNDYTNLRVTSNVRPQGDTRVLGTFFGEPNRTRDPRIVQLGIKLYF